MRIDVLLIAAMAATSVAAPTVAQDKPEAQAQAQAQADPTAEVICRRIEETGQLVKKKKKLCHTRAEWDRIAAMSRDAMGQGQMSGGSSGN